VIEALAKLVLTVALVLHYRNVVCVTIGSLIPSLIIGWGCLWPWAAKDTGVNGWQLAGHVLFRNWRACLPLLAFALACRVVPFLDFRDSMPLFFAEGAVACVIGAAGVWKWALTNDERAKISSKLGNRLARFTRRKAA
jgi:hypothetical protein